MPLAFPNPSRSYDETRKAVRFTGHDGMFEVRFYVDVNAISAMDKTLSGAGAVEAGYLSAFDTYRKAIYDVAQRVYSKGRNNIFTLAATDFR
jgi:hypothetical protein